MRNITCSATEKVLAAVVIIFIGGCTTVAQVTTLSDQDCLHTFVDRMSSILVEQGEKQEVADKLAESATTVLSTGSLGRDLFWWLRHHERTTDFLWSRSLRSVCCGCSADRRALLGTEII
jgi:hypothetical protein